MACDGQLTDGRRSLQLSCGRLGRNYVIEASSDGKTWTPFQTNRVERGTGTGLQDGESGAVCEMGCGVSASDGSGVGESGARGGQVGADFRGRMRTRSRTTERITTALPPTPTTSAPRVDTIRRMQLGSFHSRVLWGRSLRTGLGFMTWPGTCGRGAGIGTVRIRVDLKQTLGGLLRARSASSGAAVGATTRSAAGRRAATTTSRRPDRNHYFGFRSVLPPGQP